jgi:hypothetical protein
MLIMIVLDELEYGGTGHLILAFGACNGALLAGGLVTFVSFVIVLAQRSQSPDPALMKGPHSSGYEPEPDTRYKKPANNGPRSYRVRIVRQSDGPRSATCRL